MNPRIILLTVFSLVTALPASADRSSESRNNRQKAVTACNEYRVNYRLPCFVSRKRCPHGFEVLQRFNTSPGTQFLACRDLRHERPATIKRTMPSSREKRQLVQQFNRLALLADKSQVGKTYHLPKSTQKKLSTFFSNIRLDKITIHQSSAISKGCFNDCQKIYCSSKQSIDHWVNPNSEQIATSLLHQVAHAERCEILGGRERFLSTRLERLPEEVLDSLKQGSLVDASNIHYESYIERHARNRTESVCRRLYCANY